MIDPARLYSFFRQIGIEFYTGVPDSLFKGFLKYVQDHTTNDRHIITANEGLAIGLASGYYLSSGRLPLVYLQNSGLGNIINPLTSLADKEMYAVPMLLLIGWRGRPGIHDEPQHTRMGRITVSLLDAMEIPSYALEEEEEICFPQIKTAIAEALKTQHPVALLAKENLFEEYEGKTENDEYTLQREKVIERIITRLNGNEIVICTTGKIGREFYEHNKKAGNKISKYLLCAGSMGHANHVSLGIQMNLKEKMIMLDGDGALLMHLGALPVIAQHAGNHFVHIVINNGSHESVGGQPTTGWSIDLCGIAKACGYAKTVRIDTEEEFFHWLSEGLADSASCFVEIRTNRHSRNDLERPAGSPLEWRNTFMNLISRKDKDL